MLKFFPAVLCVWLLALGLTIPALGSKPISNAANLFAVLAVGIWLMDLYKKQLVASPLRVVAVVAFVFWLWLVLSWGLNGFSKTKRIESLFKFLLMVPVCWAVMKYPPNRKVLCIVLAFSSIGFFVHSVMFFNPGKVDQSILPIHSISYAHMGVVVGVCALVLSLHELKENKGLLFLGLLGGLLGVGSVFFFDVRGAIIALPITLACAVLHYRLTSPQHMIVIVAFLCVAFCGLWFGMPSFKEGIVSAYETITQSRPCSNLGIRLQLWDAAWQGALNNPGFGLGYGNFDAYRNQLVSRGELGACVKQYHVHSDYFGMLIRAGFIGFALFMAFYCSAIIKVVQLKANATTSARPYFLCALLLVIQFIVGSLTEELYVRNSSVIFFTLLLGVFVGLGVKLNKSQDKSHNTPEFK